MTPRERVLAALNLQEPDRVPWVENYVSDCLASQLVGHPVSMPEGSMIPPEILEVISLDNITFSLRPPEYTEKRESAGVEYVTQGLLKTKDDLKMINLPDPDNQAFYEPARQFLDKYKADHAAIATIRFGIATTYLSMGLETFSLSLYDDLGLVITLLDTFSEWSARVVRRINKLGFDAIIVCDDLASKSGPLFSPKIIRETFLPRMEKVVNNIDLPWIYHSDGNILPILDDLLTLGMNGIANIEPGSMDIVRLKRDYGKRVCLVGNIDLRYTLTRGTPEETEKEVKERIQQLGPGGGYILASANSLTRYCEPENVLAMDRTLRKYGDYHHEVRPHS